ncbi:hypothetical protein BDV06DRAFT_228695 [Aspergillus oleicola]
METLQLIMRYEVTDGGFSISIKGEVGDKSQAGLAIAQLLDPDPAHPAFLVSLQLPLVERGFCCPATISSIAEPMDESCPEANLTPKFSFVDLHTDYGADGVTTLIDDCRKIWFLYPPTSSNLAALASVNGQRRKLLHILHKLEAGIIVETSSSEALWIPAGCIHATFTIEGGFLVGSAFTTSQSITAISTLIASGLEKSEDAREECFNWFKKSLDAALLHRKFSDVLNAWIQAEAFFRDWAAQTKDWAKDTKEIWSKNQDDLNTAGFACPCGFHDDSTELFTHLSATHLSFLVNSRKRRRSD